MGGQKGRAGQEKNRKEKTGKTRRPQASRILPSSFFLLTFVSSDLSKQRRGNAQRRDPVHVYCLCIWESRISLTEETIIR